MRRGVAVAAFVVIWVIAFAVLVRSDFMDDAFIGFTYARNLAAGDGLTFHPHWSPVEGITNLGWVLALAALGMVFPIPAAAKVLGALLVLLTAWGLWRAGKRIFPDSLALQSAPVFLLASGVEYLFFSLSGMETAFLSAILMGMVFIAAKDPRSVWIGILGAWAFLIRPESALVVVFYVAGRIALEKGALMAVRAQSAVFAALVGLASVGRWLYFGSPIPNTFVAKPSRWTDIGTNISSAVHPLNSVFPHPLTLLVVPFVLLGAWTVVKRDRAFGSMLTAAALTGLVFSFYAPGDWTALCRYLAPYLPAFYLLLCSGLALAIGAIWKKAKIPGSGLQVSALLSFAIVLAQGFFLVQFLLPPELELYPGFVLTSRTLIEPSKWMKDNLPPGAVIAAKRIGAVSYYSERPIFDFKFGLTDVQVARLTRPIRKKFESPNAPELKERWDEVDPEFLLEDEQDLIAIARESGGSLASFKIQGREYGEFKRFAIAPGVDWVLARRNSR